MIRSELQKGRQTGQMIIEEAFGLRSPLLLAAIVVTLAGLTLPIQAQANESVEALEGQGVEALEPEGELTDGSATPIDISTVRHGEAQPPATTVEEWLAQIEASLVQITNVRVEETEAGLQIVLETAEGELAAPTTQTVGNALIADIPNAVLALPGGDSFEAFGPAEGIALVSVTNEPGDRVRVAITGTDAPPIAEVDASGLAVTLGVAVAGTDDDAIQVVVTGEGDEGYNPSNASTATGTDTPLRDIPLSIQVIPRAVIEDRNVTDLGDILETVPGVGSETERASGADGGNFTVRGLSSRIYRDGIEAFTVASLGAADIERVEVLRGPASVLFGQGGDGGLINLVSKRPLREPFYEFSVTAGSFDTYRGAVDLSGPLTETGDVRYRLNLSYENFGSFRDFVNGERLLVSPIVTWDIGPDTYLDVYGRYTYDRETTDDGIPVFGENSTVDVPRNRFLGDVGGDNFGDFIQDQFSVGYQLNHNFSDNWSLRHASEYLNFQPRRYQAFIFTADQTIGDSNRAGFYAAGDRHRFFTNAELLGRFNTGSIQHQLLFGVEYRYSSRDSEFQNFFFPYPSLNRFNPVYARQEFDIGPDSFLDEDTDTVSVYIQDQIDFTDNLIALIGVRFDYFDQFFRRQNLGSPSEESSQSDTAFSPRVGLVYQPIESLSLYASYTTSFQPSRADNLNGDGSSFEPEEGRQFEVGIKADLSERLSLNLAAFDIRRQNVVTPDPNNFALSVQTGEITSRGIELNLNGEILPGWNITTGYAYLDAFVSEDNTANVGNRLANVAEHQFSLWTTYEIQNGDLEGLGAGLGLFYVGARPGDTGNTFTLPSYFRTDAALFYQRDNWRAQINFENLFDINYLTSTNFGDSLYVNVGKPFAVTASFSISF